jgi:probable F420-dependent oxidoreductase
MPRPFRFALQAIPSGSRQEWLDLARRAEDAGFSTLHTADHLGTVDPFAPLVAAAAATTTLRFGPLVINNELHNPALLARTAASVDLMTDGRLELGIGTGYAESEHRALNIPISPPAERVRRMESSLRLLRGLLTEGKAADDRYGIDVDDLGVRPVQVPVPILVGANGRHALRVAAQLADIVQFTGLTHGEGGQPQPGSFRVEDIDERAAWVRADAGDRDVELSILVQQVVTENPEDALQTTATRFNADPQLLRDTPFLMYGSVPEVVDKLIGLRERLGVNYFTLREIDIVAPIVAALAGT